MVMSDSLIHFPLRGMSRKSGLWYVAASHSSNQYKMLRVVLGWISTYCIIILLDYGSPLGVSGTMPVI